MTRRRPRRATDIAPGPRIGCDYCRDSIAGLGFIGNPDAPRPCECRRAAQKARNKTS